MRKRVSKYYVKLPNGELMDEEIYISKNKGRPITYEVVGCRYSVGDKRFLFPVIKTLNTETFRKTMEKKPFLKENELATKNH